MNGSYAPAEREAHGGAGNAAMAVSETSQAVLSVAGVTKAIGNRKIVDGLTFDIYRGRL